MLLSNFNRELDKTAIIFEFLGKRFRNLEKLFLDRTFPLRKILNKAKKQRKPNGKQIYVGEQGSRNGESTCLPPTWAGIHSRLRCHMWIEFVGSLLCSERVFPVTQVFPSPEK